MAVQSGGKLVAAARPPTIFRRAMTLGQYRATYAQIYEQQPAVRTVVGFLGRNIAQLGLHHFRMDPEGDDRKRQRTEPLARLIRRPNPRLTQYEWINGIVCDLGIFDAHYSLKVRDRRDGMHLVPVPPELVEPIGGSWLWPDGFRIGGHGGLEVEWQHVVYLHGYHPNSRWTGLPPMEALRRILAGDHAAEDHREQFWTNGAQLSGVLSRPVEAPQWSADAKERFRSQWQARYGPNGSDAGGTPILEDGMGYEQLGSTQRDAQYIESRKLTREEVAAVYHIPPPMIGILDNANYSNVKEFHASLYQDTLGPTIEQLQQALWLQLVPDLGDPDLDYLEFNVMSKLSGTFEEQAAILSTATGGPWMTRQEARSRVNLPRIDDDAADELITPLNVTAGGQASPRDSAPPKAPMVTRRSPKALRKAEPATVEVTTDTDEADAATEVIENTFRRQHRVVEARRTAGEDDLFDRDRWDAELTADLTTAAERTALVAARRVFAAAGLDPDEASVEAMAAYLAKKAAADAEAINDTTEQALIDALGADDPAEAVAGVFGDSERASTLGWGFASAVIGFAAVDTARRFDGAQKEWIVTSTKSRHPELNGERVGIDDVFSNGARWPGDGGAGVDEAAGCTCDLLIVLED